MILRTDVPRPCRRRSSFFVVLLLMSIILAFVIFNRQDSISQSRSDQKAEPTRIRTQVHALGRLEPAGRVLELVPQSGNEAPLVHQLFVKEGDDVEANTVLVILDNQLRRQAALQEADARWEVAQARLEQIKAGAKPGDIDAQQAAVVLIEEQTRVAKREFERAQELQQRNAITKEQFDQKQWEFERLGLDRRRASSLLASIQQVRDVDVKVAEMEVAAASAAVAKARADVEASIVRAPTAGRVLRIHSFPGEKVSERGLLQMGNVRQMQAVAEVFEGDVTLLSPGMKATVTIDASKEKLTGVVDEIGHLVARKVVLTNDPVSDTDARVVEVRIALDPEHLERVTRLSNSRVEVTIHLDEVNTQRESPNDDQDDVAESRDLSNIQ